MKRINQSNLSLTLMVLFVTTNISFISFNSAPSDIGLFLFNWNSFWKYCENIMIVSQCTSCYIEIIKAIKESIKNREDQTNSISYKIGFNEIMLLSFLIIPAVNYCFPSYDINLLAVQTACTLSICFLLSEMK